MPTKRRLLATKWKRDLSQPRCSFDTYDACFTDSKSYQWASTTKITDAKQSDIVTTRQIRCVGNTVRKKSVRSSYTNWQYSTVCTRTGRQRTTPYIILDKNCLWWQRDTSTDVVGMCRRQHESGLFSCTAARVFNKLTYLLTYLNTIWSPTSVSDGHSHTAGIFTAWLDDSRALGYSGQPLECKRISAFNLLCVNPSTARLVVHLRTCGSISSTSAASVSRESAASPATSRRCRSRLVNGVSGAKRERNHSGADGEQGGVSGSTIISDHRRLERRLDLYQALAVMTSDLRLDCCNDISASCCCCWWWWLWS